MDFLLERCDTATADFKEATSRSMPPKEPALVKSMEKIGAQPHHPAYTVKRLKLSPAVKNPGTFTVTKPEGKSKRLKPLKESTKKNRRNAARRGKLSGDTSPAKSNLTFSGDMIDSINHKAKKGSVKLKVDEIYAKFVAEDRPFMNLSKTQVKETIEKLQDDLVKLITKLLK